MEIDYLCDRPVLIPELARAHVAAFGALLPDWTVAQAEDELRSHTRRRAIPTTWVAMEGEQWLGSVSLLQNDHDDIRQYSPWLASLYVCPRARSGGVGRALVARCVEEAAALAVPRLYLYCTDALTDYYRALGWRIQDRLLLGPLSVAVMAIEPAR
ncbi:GNAT family N-acetyltransferase [Pseudoxanthomonas wuyuanensis]|uniref:Acetyltransferase (GNAT) family protein n=1 Tax=Pseudoxanthomonas wuyuanensis TaxID=1073196 RepID=A0A286DCB5_9GAMM|nr:GNAT family N-acetyltransferase [Pseudoxanthomonas wuyuanensis]KAF1717259.1 N-acetyltransferase [Pseudoxanthomonas wuyuanensis]SOD56273.1 Acetyltransferase (GNAT) family protein [Pseudoxanthomonas wuyuanensis]